MFCCGMYECGGAPRGSDGDCGAKTPGGVHCAGLKGHTDTVTGVPSAPTASLLASASADKTLRLWDVANVHALGAPLIGHDGPVLAVAFSADGQRLASGSADHTVALWQVSPSLIALASQDWPTRACTIAGRNLTQAEWAQYFGLQPYRKTCQQWPDGQ